MIPVLNDENLRRSIDDLRKAADEINSVVQIVVLNKRQEDHISTAYQLMGRVIHTLEGEELRRELVDRYNVQRDIPDDQNNEAN